MSRRVGGRLPAPLPRQARQRRRTPPPSRLTQVRHVPLRRPEPLLLSPRQPAPEAQGTEETAAKGGILDGLKVVAKNGEAKDRAERLAVGQAPVVFDTADSPACTDCGSIMVRNGSCYKCINCGATSGCS